MSGCGCGTLVEEHRHVVDFWLKPMQCPRCGTWHYIVPGKGVAHIAAEVMRGENKFRVLREVTNELMKRPMFSFGGDAA